MLCWMRLLCILALFLLCLAEDELYPTTNRDRYEYITVPSVYGNIDYSWLEVEYAAPAGRVYLFEPEDDLALIGVSITAWLISLTSFDLLNGGYITFCGVDGAVDAENIYTSQLLECTQLDQYTPFPAESSLTFTGEKLAIVIGANASSFHHWTTTLSLFVASLTTPYANQDCELFSLTVLGEESIEFSFTARYTLMDELGHSPDFSCTWVYFSQNTADRVQTTITSHFLNQYDFIGLGFDADELFMGYEDVDWIPPFRAANNTNSITFYSLRELRGGLGNTLPDQPSTFSALVSVTPLLYTPEFSAAAAPRDSREVKDGDITIVSRALAVSDSDGFGAVISSPISGVASGFSSHYLSYDDPDDDFLVHVFTEHGHSATGAIVCPVSKFGLMAYTDDNRSASKLVVVDNNDSYVFLRSRTSGALGAHLGQMRGCRSVVATVGPDMLTVLHLADNTVYTSTEPDLEGLDVPPTLDSAYKWAHNAIDGALGFQWLHLPKFLMLSVTEDPLDGVAIAAVGYRKGELGDLYFDEDTQTVMQDFTDPEVRLAVWRRDIATLSAPLDATTVLFDPEPITVAIPVAESVRSSLTLSTDVTYNPMYVALATVPAACLADAGAFASSAAAHASALLLLAVGVPTSDTVFVYALSLDPQAPLTETDDLTTLFPVGTPAAELVADDEALAAATRFFVPHASVLSSATLTLLGVAQHDGMGEAISFQPSRESATIEADGAATTETVECPSTLVASHESAIVWLPFDFVAAPSPPLSPAADSLKKSSSDVIETVPQIKELDALYTIPNRFLYAAENWATYAERTALIDDGRVVIRLASDTLDSDAMYRFLPGRHSQDPDACPAGTFASSAYPSMCELCPPGYWSPAGMTAGTGCVACEAGEVCPAGSITALPASLFPTYASTFSWEQVEEIEFTSLIVFALRDNLLYLVIILAALVAVICCLLCVALPFFPWYQTRSALKARRRLQSMDLNPSTVLDKQRLELGEKGTSTGGALTIALALGVLFVIIFTLIIRGNYDGDSDDFTSTGSSDDCDDADGSPLEGCVVHYNMQRSESITQREFLTTVRKAEVTKAENAGLALTVAFIGFWAPDADTLTSEELIEAYCPSVTSSGCYVQGSDCSDVLQPTCSLTTALGSDGVTSVAVLVAEYDLTQLRDSDGDVVAIDFDLDARFEFLLPYATARASGIVIRGENPLTDCTIDPTAPCEAQAGHFQDVLLPEAISTAGDAMHSVLVGTSRRVVTRYYSDMSVELTNSAGDFRNVVATQWLLESDTSGAATDPLSYLTATGDEDRLGVLLYVETLRTVTTGTQQRVSSGWNLVAAGGLAIVAVYGLFEAAASVITGSVGVAKSAYAKKADARQATPVLLVPIGPTDTISPLANRTGRPC
jgi:hypothetical protein